MKVNWIELVLGGFVAGKGIVDKDISLIYSGLILVADSIADFRKVLKNGSPAI